MTTNQKRWEVMSVYDLYIFVLVFWSSSWCLYVFISFIYCTLISKLVGYPYYEIVFWYKSCCAVHESEKTMGPDAINALSVLYLQCPNILGYVDPVDELRRYKTKHHEISSFFFSGIFLWSSNIQTHREVGSELVPPNWMFDIWRCGPKSVGVPAILGSYWSVTVATLLGDNPCRSNLSLYPSSTDKLT